MSSFFSSPVVERAFNRSRVRGSIVLALLAHGPLFLGQLSRMTGHDPENVLGALVGERGAYKSVDSLVGLGIVSWVASERGDLFELTGAGRSEALCLVSREHQRFATWA